MEPKIIFVTPEAHATNFPRDILRLLDFGQTDRLIQDTYRHKFAFLELQPELKMVPDIADSIDPCQSKWASPFVIVCVQ